MWDKWTCARAAGSGNLEMLKWARQNGCDWDYETCLYATRNLEILKWARENGCDWDGNTCLNAAKSGKLEMLKWPRQNGCPWNTYWCQEEAIQQGHFEVERWIKQNDCLPYDGIVYYPSSDFFLPWDQDIELL